MTRALWFAASMLAIVGCSGGSDADPVSDAGASEDAEASTTCGVMPDNMDCFDVCDGHVYGPSCVKGQWKCVYKSKENCPDAAPDVPCGPKPTPLKCSDPCSGQPYEPTCEGGGWACRNLVPDGGCVKPDRTPARSNAARRSARSARSSVANRRRRERVRSRIRGRVRPGVRGAPRRSHRATRSPASARIP
jgi:hypothetical protein